MSKKCIIVPAFNEAENIAPVIEGIRQKSDADIVVIEDGSIDQTITDPTSGYQCLNRRVFKGFTEDLFPCHYPDANIIILLHRMGYRIKEVPVAMLPNSEGRSMHRGVFRVSYYFFEMFLSLFVTLLRDKKGR